MNESNRTSDKLSRREREIMEILYAAAEPVPAEAVRAALSDPPSYSAVRAMLARLEAKGHVQHEERGPRYHYAPTTPRHAARRGALSRLVSVFFDGSPRHTVTALLRSERWTDEELDALSEEIVRARQQSRPQ